MVPADSGIEIANLLAAEDQAAVEFIGRGTNTGPLHLSTGDLPPTGESSSCTFVMCIASGMGGLSVTAAPTMRLDSCSSSASFRHSDYRVDYGGTHWVQENTR